MGVQRVGGAIDGEDMPITINNRTAMSRDQQVGRIASEQYGLGLWNAHHLKSNQINPKRDRSATEQKADEDQTQA